MISRYLALVEEFRGGRILEFGIYEGGSAALLALVLSPRKIVVLDLLTNPDPHLDEFIASRGLGETLVSYWDVSQADRDRVVQIVEAEFAGECIDLIIDDASHRYVETRAALETTLPYLSDGGLYVIEDWSSELQLGLLVAKCMDEPGTSTHEVAARTLRNARKDAGDALHNLAVALDAEDIKVGAYQRWLQDLAARGEWRPLAVLAADLVMTMAWGGAALKESVAHLQVCDDWIALRVKRAAGDSIGPEVEGDQSQETGGRVVDLRGLPEEARTAEALAQKGAPTGGDGLLDLVIEDALVAASALRATFDTAFPLVRPGGTYVIDHWASESRSGGGAGQFVADLVVDAALGESGIGDIDVSANRTVVTRGPGPYLGAEKDRRALVTCLTSEPRILPPELVPGNGRVIGRR